MHHDCAKLIITSIVPWLRPIPPPQELAASKAKTAAPRSIIDPDDPDSAPASELHSQLDDAARLRARDAQRIISLETLVAELKAVQADHARALRHEQEKTRAAEAEAEEARARVAAVEGELVRAVGGARLAEAGRPASGRELDDMKSRLASIEAAREDMDERRGMGEEQKLAVVRAAVTELSEANAKLRREVAEARDELRDAVAVRDEEIARLRAGLMDEKKRAAAQIGGVDKAERLTQHVQHLQKQVVALKREKEDEAKKLEQNVRLLEDCEKTIRLLEQQDEAKEETIAQMESNEQKMRAAMAANERKFQASIVEKDRASEQAQKSLEQKWVLKVEELESRLPQAAHAANVAAKLHAAIKDRDAYAAKLLDLEKQLGERTSMSQNFQLESEETIARLRAQKADDAKKFAELETRIQTLTETAAGQLSGDQDAYAKQILALESEREASKRRVMELERKLEVAEASLDELKTRLAQQTESLPRTGSSNTSGAELENELQQRAMDIEQLKNARAELEGEKAGLALQIADLQLKEEVKRADLEHQLAKVTEELENILDIHAACSAGNDANTATEDVPPSKADNDESLKPRDVKSPVSIRDAWASLLLALSIFLGMLLGSASQSISTPSPKPASDIPVAQGEDAAEMPNQLNPRKFPDRKRSGKTKNT
eukprot:CAMPEP_0174891976 /NCGR_PEP_ID=MMETSP0167-20121228/6987_1 /TAXON_ID=38298 /ORGANISM="Rhodella maculata, Strain CCMP736" /LENGTH=664 /DNA_ID=CAMNT_0016130317 /DNA_START=65 /DNA_END=2062 /DNA_ORIENTATION=+